MNIWIFHLLLGSIILFSACIKEADIIQPKIEPKLVLNSFLTPHNPMKFYVSSTKNIGDTILPIIRNATIYIWEDGVLIDSLKNGNQNGLYKSELKPYPQKNYTIKVKAPGFKEIIATEFIPQKVLIDSAICTYGEFVEPGEGGSKLYSMSVYFNDPPKVKNYYEIQVFDQDNKNDPDYISSITEVTDAALIAEGDQDFHPSSFFFNDEIFDGTQYRFNVRYWGVHSSKTENIYVLFRSISKNYYQYRKFWTKHNFNQNDTEFLEDPYDIFFKSEPLPMFTNIENGLGIAAGYQEEIYLSMLIRLKNI